MEKEDFIWYEKRANNIKENPLEYWYTCYYNGDHSRKYYIMPQYPLAGKVCVDKRKEPELYVLFEAMGSKITDDISYSDVEDGYKYERNGSFKRVFKTLEEAKERAYVDYYMVFGYAASFIK